MSNALSQVSKVIVRSKDIKIIPVSSVIENDKNRNKHPKEQIERLKKIIEYQGFRVPIIISNRSGKMVAGHGRLLAAKSLGLTEIPAIYQDFDSEEQEFAAGVSENSIASWAELDLSGIHSDLPDMEPFDLDLLGIRGFELEPTPGLVDEDAVPDVPDEPTTKLGDLYQLGNHRLLCGDSTDKAQVERLMGGEKADICFTSPPYNLGENAKLRGYNGDGEDTVYTEKNDHRTQDKYLEFMTAWTSIAIEHSRYVFCNVQILAGNKLAIPKYWMHFVSRLVDVMVWDKEHAPPQMAARVLNSVFEFIFIFTDEENPKRSIKTGAEWRGTVDNILRLNPNRGPREESSASHGAVFPVSFAQYFVEKFSDRSVLEMFCGSGSTLIACEKTNRRCFGMEIDPHYCDVIVKRWEEYTGKKAEKIGG